MSFRTRPTRPRLPLPKKSPPVEDSDLFDCALCKGVEGSEMSDFKKHRAEVHDAQV